MSAVWDDGGLLSRAVRDSVATSLAKPASRRLIAEAISEIMTDSVIGDGVDAIAVDVAKDVIANISLDALFVGQCKPEDADMNLALRVGEWNTTAIAYDYDKPPIYSLFKAITDDVGSCENWPELRDWMVLNLEAMVTRLKEWKPKRPKIDS